MAKIINCKKNKIFNKLSVYVFSVASALFTEKYLYCSNGKNNINNVNNGINTSNNLDNLNINSIINDFDLKEQNKNSQINTNNNNILNNPILNNQINYNNNILDNLNINSIINDFDLEKQNKNNQINPNNNILNNPILNSQINPNNNILNNPIFNSQINPNNNILNNPIFNSQINPNNNILDNTILNSQINHNNNILDNLILNNQIISNNNILNNLILNTLILNSQINQAINNMLNFNDNILRKPCIQNKLNINNNIYPNQNILNNNNNSNLINSLSYNLFTRRENDFFDEFRRINTIQKSNNINYENLINYNSSQSSDFIKEKPEKTKKINSLLGRKRENTSTVDVKNSNKKTSRFSRIRKFKRIKSLFFDYLVEIINKIIDEEVSSEVVNSICNKLINNYEASKSENEKDMYFQYLIQNKNYICRIRKATIKDSDEKNFSNILNMTVYDFLTKNTIVEYRDHRDKNFNKNFLNELDKKKEEGKLKTEKLDEILNLKLIVCFSRFAENDLNDEDGIKEKSSDVLNEYMEPFGEYYTKYCNNREKNIDSEYINALKEILSELIHDYKAKDLLSNQIKIEISNNNNIE